MTCSYQDYYSKTIAYWERAWADYNILLLLHGRHQRHCPAHKSHNLVRAVRLILSMQYQQKPSADIIKSQRTAWCWPRSNNKPFNVGEDCVTRFKALRLWSRGVIQHSANESLMTCRHRCAFASLMCAFEWNCSTSITCIFCTGHSDTFMHAPKAVDGWKWHWWQYYSEETESWRLTATSRLHANIAFTIYKLTLPFHSLRFSSLNDLMKMLVCDAHTNLHGSNHLVLFVIVSCHSLQEPRECQ